MVSSTYVKFPLSGDNDHFEFVHYAIKSFLVSNIWKLEVVFQPFLGVFGQKYEYGCHYTCNVSFNSEPKTEEGLVQTLESNFCHVYSIGFFYLVIVESNRDGKLSLR